MRNSHSLWDKFPRSSGASNLLGTANVDIATPLAKTINHFQARARTTEGQPPKSRLLTYVSANATNALVTA